MSFWGTFSAVGNSLTAQEREKREAERAAKDAEYIDGQRARNVKAQDEEQSYQNQIKAVARPQPIAGPMPVDEATGQEAPRPMAQGVMGAAAARARASIAEEFGKMDDSTKYKRIAEEAEKEGATGFITGVRGAAPDAATLAKSGGSAFFDIPEDTIKAYDAAGKIKVPAGARAQAYIVKRPDGSETTDVRLLDAAGKPIYNSLNTIEQAITMGAAQRMEADQTERKLGHQAQQIRQQGVYQHGVLKSHEDDRKLRADLERAKLNMSDQQFQQTYGLKKTEMDLDAYRASTERIKATAGGAPGGVTREDVNKADDWLKDSFTTTDLTSGAKGVDWKGFDFARQITLAAMSTNGGDAGGAAIQGKRAHEAIMRAAGGDPQAAQALMEQALMRLRNPGAAQQGGQPQGQAPAQPGQVPQPRVARPQPVQDPVVAQLSQAQAELQRWGSRQRAADPAGFERARQALAAAEAAAAQAQQPPELTPAERAQVSRPSFRLPTP